LGLSGPIAIGLWYFFSILLLKAVSPAFGKMVAFEQKMEGIFRSQQANIVNHSEEIAFYNGHEWER